MNINTEKNTEDISMSKIFSIIVYILIGWGVVFIALQGLGFVDWKWYFNDGDSSSVQNTTHTFYDSVQGPHLHLQVRQEIRRITVP